MATPAQIRLVHSIAQQVAEYTGHEVSEIVQEGKNRAMRRGYPMVTDENLNAVGASLKEATTEEAGHLIEELYQIAAEVGALYQE